VPYTVSTPVFEGPFDLLLHLITRQQVDLWEVSVSSIVDAYVATLADLRAALDLEAATEFLLIAAVLLELKAQRPTPSTSTRSSGVGRSGTCCSRACSSPRPSRTRQAPSPA
jgi:chromatin segregation and condensation protein Rec8/ScpA/Scc1 (kleisin family)